MSIERPRRPIGFMTRGLALATAAAAALAVASKDAIDAFKSFNFDALRYSGKYRPRRGYHRINHSHHPHQGKRERARRLSFMAQHGLRPDVPPFAATATQPGPQFNRAPKRAAHRAALKAAKKHKQVFYRLRENPRHQSSGIKVATA